MSLFEQASVRTKFPSSYFTCLVTGRHFHRLASGSVYFSPCFSLTPHTSQVSGVASLSLDDSEPAQWAVHVFLAAQGQLWGQLTITWLCTKVTVNHRHKCHYNQTKFIPTSTPSQSDLEMPVTEVTPLDRKGNATGGDIRVERDGALNQLQPKYLNFVNLKTIT